MTSLVIAVLYAALATVLAIAYHVLSLFVGREKAAQKFKQVCFKIGTWYQAKRIPELKEGESFSKFIEDYERALPVPKMKGSVIKEKTDYVYSFEIHYCPWAKYAKAFRIVEVAKGFCESDFEFIEKYQPRIKLEVEHSIMEGYDYCDFKFSLRN